MVPHGAVGRDEQLTVQVDGGPVGEAGQEQGDIPGNDRSIVGAVDRVPFSLLTADPDENRPPIPKVRIKKEVREMGSADYDQEQMVKAAMELAAQQGGDPEQTRQSLTTLLAAIDKPRRLKTYITLKPSEKMLLQFTHRQRITPAADGTMHFKDLAPLPQYCIKTGGSIHYAVALPRPLDGLTPQLVPEQCQPVGWTQAPMGERMWLWWRWQNDPLLEVVYRY